MTQQVLTQRRLLLGELGLAVHLVCYAVLPPYSTILDRVVHGLFGVFVSPGASIRIASLVTFLLVPLALGVVVLLETRPETTTRLDTVVRVGAMLMAPLVVGAGILITVLQTQDAPSYVVGGVGFLPYYGGLAFALVVLFRFVRERPLTDTA